MIIEIKEHIEQNSEGVTLFYYLNYIAFQVWHSFFYMFL